MTSPVDANGGWLVMPLLSEPARLQLADEAFACHARASEVRRAVAENEDTVRGDPRRWLEMAPGGPCLEALFSDPDLPLILAEMTAEPWRPAGQQASYSYYRAAGHFLGLHRDIEGCDLAMIVAVHEVGCPAASTSGRLRIFPDDRATELSRLQAGHHGSAVEVHLEPSQALVLRGGSIPHELLPLAEGHVRIVAPLCFDRVAR